MDTKDINPELKRAYLMYIEYKHKIEPNSITDDVFEKYEKIFKKNFDGQTDDQIIRYLTNEVATGKRQKQQFYMRLWVWGAVNIYLFWDIGFDSILSIGGIVWLAGGTVFILTIWSLIGAFFERAWMMKGWNFNVWRTIEYVSMYLISKNILNGIF